MITRIADIDPDRDQLLAGAKNFLSRMDFSSFLPADDATFEATILNVLQSDIVEVVVAEHDGKIVAGLGMAFVPFLWNPVMTQADELFWWAAPDSPPTAALSVLRFAIRSMKQADGTIIAMFKKLTSSPDAVDSVYRRMGLQKVETSYMGVF